MSEYDDLDRHVSRMLASVINVVDRRWHPESAPKSAHDAWDEWQEAVEHCEDLHAEFIELGWKVKNQEEGQRRAHLEHARGGPKPKAYKPVDYQAMRKDKAFEIEAARSVAEHARRAYRQLADDPEMLREWRTSLLARFEGMQEEAKIHLEAARQTFKSWRGTINFLGMTAQKLGFTGQRGAPPNGEFYRYITEVENAWDSLFRVVNTNDPVHSGRWVTMTEEQLSVHPPMWERERMSLGYFDGEERCKLRSTELRERREGKVISSYEVPAGMTPEAARKLVPTSRGLVEGK
ncbi:hypothetical protein ABZ370_38555 [Streptomyces sp. NPDC005962]|uniref:hypothetical protein n=1 Tax=Streptomyces sp. NPDC005962 TaxID=3154466 RepID=UPI003407E825